MALCYQRVLYPLFSSPCDRLPLEILRCLAPLKNSIDVGERLKV